MTDDFEMGLFGSYSQAELDAEQNARELAEKRELERRTAVERAKTLNLPKPEYGLSEEEDEYSPYTKEYIEGVYAHIRRARSGSRRRAMRASIPEAVRFPRIRPISKLDTHEAGAARTYMALSALRSFEALRRCCLECPDTVTEAHSGGYLSLPASRLPLTDTEWEKFVAIMAEI